MVKLTENIVYSRTKHSAETVRRLNLWGCDIDDISLCEKMINLEILSISVNRVRLLKPLKKCTNLQELYIRRNDILDLNQLEHLKPLKQLRILWSDENPCSKDELYRRKVLKMLPNLFILDDKVVTQEEVANSMLDACRNSSNSPNWTEMSTKSHDLAMNCDYSYLLAGQNQMTDSFYCQNEPTTPIAENDHYCPSIMTNSLSIDSSMSRNRDDLMSKSVRSDNKWQDFEVDAKPDANSLMSQSMYSGSTLSKFSPLTSRSFSAHRPGNFRRRRYSGSRSASPTRAQRHENIVSAISALLDELDQSGLRSVIEEAQEKLKKQR